MYALLLLVDVIGGTADLIARATALTSAERRCAAVADSTDITVCGLRRADRYRVPLVVNDPGDPRHEGVAAERDRLLHRTTPIEDMSPFLVGGGMVGVSAGIDTATGAVSQRKLAP